MITASDIIKAHGEEPRYSELEEGTSTGGRPKWQKPNTDLAKRALAVCGRKYYLRGEKSKWIKIEKAMVSLAMAESVYPSEWVEAMISWAEKMNKPRIKISFPALLNGIDNEDRKTDFIAKWKNKNGNSETIQEIPKANYNGMEDIDWS